MHIQWTTKNELGEIITENHPFLTLDNVSTYAKRNHRACNGTGVEHWDNGWEYYYEMNEELGRSILCRRPLNPRILACSCVLRTISKAGL